MTEKQFRLAALALAAASLPALFARGGSDSQTTAAQQDKPQKDAGSYTVGICRLVQYSAHDDAARGFMGALN